MIVEDALRLGAFFVLDLILIDDLARHEAEKAGVVLLRKRENASGDLESEGLAAFFVAELVAAVVALRQDEILLVQHRLLADEVDDGLLGVAVPEDRLQEAGEGGLQLAVPLRLQNALDFVEEAVATRLGRLVKKRVQSVTVARRVVGALLVLFHALLEVALGLLIKTADLLLVRCGKKRACE